MIRKIFTGEKGSRTNTNASIHLTSLMQAIGRLDDKLLNTFVLIHDLSKIVTAVKERDAPRAGQLVQDHVCRFNRLMEEKRKKGRSEVR